MDKHLMEKLEEQFCMVLSEIAKGGLKSTNEVQTAKNCLSGLVKIKALEAMNHGEYSEREKQEEENLEELNEKLRKIMEEGSDNERKILRHLVDMM